MTTFTGEIHPYADAFPMLDDESLKALAEDIAANGLRHPIVLDPSGALIDGRNRLRACELAGVEPQFVVHDGDPVPLVISENMQRRDLTQGQKAHLAVACLEPKQSIRDLAKIAGISPAYFAQAITIRDFAPHLVPQVIAGDMPHSTAYERARAIKVEADQEAERLKKLRAWAPDLLEKELPPEEAWAAYQARTKEQREREEEELRAALEEVEAISTAMFKLSQRENRIDELIENLRTHRDKQRWPVVDRLDSAAAVIAALQTRRGKLK